MDYRLIRSNRRTIAIEITDSAEVLVRAPIFASVKQIEKFVQSKQNWIEKTVNKQKIRFNDKKAIFETDIDVLYEKGRQILDEKFLYWAKRIGVTPTGVKITKAKKRFGSCNAKNSICFSVYLFAYPEEAVEYVIVHELCHIKQHNHSPRFWALVQKHLPDYKDREKLLK